MSNLVKTKIVSGNAEYNDPTHAPKKGEKQRRITAKKGAVVEMSQDDFDSLKGIGAVVKATKDEPVAAAVDPKHGETLAQPAKTK